LAADTTVTVPPGLNGSFPVVIAFVEKADHPEGSGANASMMRQTQYPNVAIMTTPIDHAVALGTVSFVGGQATQALGDGRMWSGLRLPGLGSSTGYLRPQTGSASGVAELGCSLSVKGGLAVGSDTSLKGKLGVTGDANLGNATVGGTLLV